MREPHFPRLPPKSQRPIAVVGATVIPMTGPVKLRDHTVIITNGRITAIGPRPEIDTDGTRVVDAAGRYLMPGLTDAHAHLLNFADSVLFLSSGVTRIRNMFGFPEHLAYARLVEAGHWAGPRLISASTIVDGANALGRPTQAGAFVVLNDEDAQRLVPKLKATGYAHIKGYSLLTPEAHAALGRAARDHDFAFGGHCPMTLTFERAIAQGQTSFEHLMSISLGRLGKEGNAVVARVLETGAYPDYDAESLKHLSRSLDMASIARLAEQMATDGVWNCPTLTVVDRVCAPASEFAGAPWLEDVAPHWLNSWNRVDQLLPNFKDLADLRTRVLNANRDIVSALHDAGAPLLVGTDTPNPWVPPGASVLAELQNFVAAGISPYDALRYATVEPARFLGLPEGTSTVQVGQLADLVLLKGDPLASIRAVGDVEAVFVNGWHLDAAALKDARDGLKRQNRDAASSTPTLKRTPPAGARVRIERHLASRIFGVRAGSLAYRCCDLPDGRQILDEVEELLGATTERHVVLNSTGEVLSGRVTRRTPVGATIYDITVDRGVDVRVDDHGIELTVHIPDTCNVLPGPGVSAVALAIASKAESGATLALTRTGVRVIPATIDRGDQVTVAYEHWSTGMMPTSLTVRGDAVIAGDDLCDMFPRNLCPPEADDSPNVTSATDAGS